MKDKKENFLNTPTRKFYWFFKEKINKKELDNKIIAEKFQKYKANPSGLLNGLIEGKYSVTIEMILLAQEHFALKPCNLFQKEQDSYEITEDEVLSLVKEVKPKDKDLIKVLAETVQSQQEELKELRTFKEKAFNKKASSG